MKTATFMLAVGAALALPVAANAEAAPNGALTITFSQSGGNVVETASGFLNTTGLTVYNFSNAMSQVNAGAAQAIVGNTGVAWYYSAFTGPSNFGSGGLFTTFNFTGPDVGFDLSSLYAPTGYTSGSAVSSSATYAGATFASLGLNTGTYNYTSNQNAITVKIGSAAVGAVPEAATWTMMIGGFGAVGVALRRRGKQTVHFAKA